MAKKTAIIRDTTFARQEDDEESLGEFLRRAAREAFDQHLPMDALKELPSWYKYVFGVIGYGIAVATMIYFTYTLFQQQTTKRFIALSHDDGECEPVSTQITGEFMGTSRGLWEGQEGFVYSEAKYSFHLTGYVASNEDYGAMMDIIENELIAVAEGAVHRDASENLLYWMTWSVNSGTDYFEMMGDPTSILNREYFYGTLGGVAGECQAEPEAHFTVATAEMELFFSKDKFSELEYCTAAATPEWMGYVPRFMKNNFRIKIDAWQAMVAIAVNLGEMDMNLLQPVQGTQTTLNFHDETLYLLEVFDFRYPGMLPLSCISEDSDITNMKFRACLLRQGDTYMLPVMNHFGTAREFPEPCNCTNGDKENRECHNLDLMVSVLFYNLPPYDEELVNSTQPQATNNSLYAVLALLESDSYKNINKNAYNISYAGCRFNQWTDPVWRRNAYDFCNMSEYGTCSMIMYNPYDRRSRSVSPFYYQVPEIACTDSFTTPYWNRLRSTSPAPLDERYLQCTVPWYEAIFEAQGIAAGNAALAVPLIMGFLLPFLFLYMKKTGNNPPKPEYTDEELTNASRAHALYMLRVRDKKTRGFVQDSVLMQTARELMNVTGQEVGYSDSDDESDEEDEEDEEEDDNDQDVENGGRWNGPVATSIRKKLNKNGVKSDHIDKNEVEMVSGQLKPTITPRLTRARGLIVINSFKHLSSKFSRRRRLHDCVTMTDLKEVLQKLSDMFDKALSVRGKNGSGASFRNALHESLYLKNVKLDAIYSGRDKKDARECFKILQHVMRVHACLEFDLSLQGITSAVGKYAAYNIGGRVLTLEEVKDVAVLNTSPFVLGFYLPKDLIVK